MCGVTSVGNSPSFAIRAQSLGKPNIREHQFDAWAELFKEAGHFPNVYCKLSGMVTEARPGWTDASLAPFVQAAVGAFGYRRLMFGSDWPVCLLAGAYERVLGALRGALAQVLKTPSAEDEARLFERTATGFYAL